MVTGARPPDLITVGVAGSCLVDRDPVVGRLESRKALWAAVGNRVPANLRQFPARLVETVADAGPGDRDGPMALPVPMRSEEHTSELQSLMRISYAVYCLTKKKS